MSYLRFPHRAAPLLLTLLLIGVACTHAPPRGIAAVTPFDIQRYEGKWYEIARLDHWYERGLTDVNATYTARPDGTVQVINRGYDPAKRTWRQAEGKARFAGKPGTGSLQVSFFGPFYGGYHVVALDEAGYRWSLVAGDDRDALWILARDKQLTPELRNRLIERARSLGFEVNALIWTPQSRPDS